MHYKKSPAALLIFLLPLIFLFSCTETSDSGSADEDNVIDGDDDNLDDDLDDDQADDDVVDDEWNKRCENCVESTYELCRHNLFNLDQNDAVDSCNSRDPFADWDCIVNCWEWEPDCSSWFYCINDQCHYQDTDDDDDIDDDADDDDEQDIPCDGPGQYVIVAGNGLMDSLDDLIDYRSSQGHTVIAKSLSEIDGTGGDDLSDALAVREFLKETYEPGKVNYLLIVGSISKIPMLLMYPDPLLHDLYQIYSDYFYADISGDFDSDGDGFYGEWGEDNYDLNPEYHVGRIPLDEPNRIEDVVNDTIDFEEGLLDHYQNVMLGAVHIAIVSDASLLMTVIRNWVVTPGGYDATTLFERGGLIRPDVNLTRFNLMQYWPNNPSGMFLWASHGDPISAGGVGYDFIHSEDALFYENMGTVPGIVMSSGCRNSNPLWYDNLGAASLGRMAAAFVGSTAYTNPGAYGEGSLVFLVAVDQILNRRNPIACSVDHSKKVYMDSFFGLIAGYETGFYFQNFMGFQVYGDPALKYPRLNK